nr:toxin glutamine deamidase domain-containing protein [Nocardia sp. GTS18]
MQFPSWLEPLEWLVGADWPHGNEDLMWQMGKDLLAAADDAQALVPDLEAIVTTVNAAYPQGRGGESILQWIQPLIDGQGPDKNGSLAHLAQHWTKLATAADSGGDQLQAAKLNFYIAGAWLLTELAWAAAAGPGAPLAHAIVISQARTVFRWMGKKLLTAIGHTVARNVTEEVLERIAVKLVYEIVQESLVELGQGTSQELAVQYIQNKTGHINGYDWKAVGLNAGISAIAGGVGGAAGFGLGRKLPTTNGGWTGARNGATTGAGAGLAGATAAYLATGAFTGQWDFDPRSFTGGAASGAGPSAIHGYRGNSDFAGQPFTDPHDTAHAGIPTERNNTETNTTSDTTTNGNDAGSDTDPTTTSDSTDTDATAPANSAESGENSATTPRADLPAGQPTTAAAGLSTDTTTEQSEIEAGSPTTDQTGVPSTTASTNPTAVGSPAHEATAHAADTGAPDTGSPRDVTASSNSAEPAQTVATDIATIENPAVVADSGGMTSAAALEHPPAHGGTPASVATSSATTSTATGFGLPLGATSAAATTGAATTASPMTRAVSDGDAPRARAVRDTARPGAAPGNESPRPDQTSSTSADPGAPRSRAQEQVAGPSTADTPIEIPVQAQRTGIEATVSAPEPASDAAYSMAATADVDEIPISQDTTPAASSDAQSARVVHDAIDEALPNHPDLARILHGLLDDPHALDLTRALKRPALRAQTLALLHQLADSELLTHQTLTEFITANPGRGPLFDPLPSDINHLPDGRSRMAALVAESKALDPARSIGAQPSTDEIALLEDYADRLKLAVQPAVKAELARLTAGLEGATTNSRTKPADAILDKVHRMVNGAENRPPRPHYQVGDAIDAVGARITVDSTEQLAALLTRIQQQLGTGDNSRIVEIENMYATPKSRNPEYRVIPMVIRIDVDGLPYTYELQLTTRRASIAADINHNTVYKPYIPLTPAQRDEVNRVFAEAAALDQIENRTTATTANTTDIRPGSRPASPDLSDAVPAEPTSPPDITGQLETPTPSDLAQVSAETAQANTPALVPDLHNTRTIGPERLAQLEDDSYLTAVQEALLDGDRFVVGADPRTNDYGQLINDGGPKRNGRGYNCVDTALAALSSFFGRPAVALPRFEEYLPSGELDTRGELGGLDRAESWIGGTWEDFDGQGLSAAEQFDALHDWISQMGPGSAAFVYNQWHARDDAGDLMFDEDGQPVGGDHHATAIVFPHGADSPVWWDPQSGEMTAFPPTELVDHSVGLTFMSIDSNGGTVNAGSTGNQTPGTTVSGPSPAVGQGVPAHGVPALLGGQSDPDAGGNAATNRRGDLRGEQDDRSGDVTPERPTTTPDRPEIRPGGSERRDDRSVPDVSPAMAHDLHSNPRGPQRDPVPGGGDVTDGTTGRGFETNPDNRQADTELSNRSRSHPSEQHHSERLGSDAQPQRRDLAETGDDRALTSAAGPTEQQDGTAQAQGLPSDAHPAYDARLPRGEGVLHRPTSTSIGQDSHTARVRENIRNDGAHDVIVHGRPDGFPIPGKVRAVHPQEIVDAIRENPNYRQGTPIRLVSCYAGNGKGWAQYVADALGVTVTAATDRIGVPRELHSAPIIDNGGRWRVFRPQSLIETTGPRFEPELRAAGDLSAGNDSTQHYQARTDWVADTPPRESASGYLRPPTELSGLPRPRVDAQFLGSLDIGDPRITTDGGEPPSITHIDGEPVDDFARRLSAERGEAFVRAAEPDPTLVSEYTALKAEEYRLDAEKRDSGVQIKNARLELSRAEVALRSATPEQRPAAEELVRQRQEEFQTAREAARRAKLAQDLFHQEGQLQLAAKALEQSRAETLSAAKRGNCSAVTIDRLTGRVFEAANGPSTDHIHPNSLHPTLIDNIARYQDPNTIDDNPDHTKFPHHDHPLGHAEVRSTDAALHDREQLNSTAEHSGRYPTDHDGLSSLLNSPFVPRRGVEAPYCANCTRVLTGTESTAGHIIDEGAPRVDPVRHLDLARAADDTQSVRPRLASTDYPEVHPQAHRPGDSDMEWLSSDHDSTPEALPVTPEQIESKYGIPLENQAKLRRYAEANGLVIDVRPTNPDAVPHLKNGAMPKPMSIKDKTINDLDIELGAPAAAKGLVGRFEPGMLSMPDTTEMSGAHREQLRARLNRRNDDWVQYAEHMDKLTGKNGHFRVTDGIVEGKVDGVWKPVTGDHDLFDIRHADGQRLTSDELRKHQSRLIALGAGIQHGPHTYWETFDPYQRANNFEKIITDHQYDPDPDTTHEPVIRITPDGHPTVRWAEQSLTDIDREMTLWHVQSDIDHGTTRRLGSLARLPGLEATPGGPLTDVPADESHTVRAEAEQLRGRAEDLVSDPIFDLTAYRAWMGHQATSNALIDGVPMTAIEIVEGEPPVLLRTDSPEHELAALRDEARKGQSLDAIRAAVDQRLGRLDNQVTDYDAGIAAAQELTDTENDGTQRRPTHEPEYELAPDTEPSAGTTEARGAESTEETAPESGAAVVSTARFDFHQTVDDGGRRTTELTLRVYLEQMRGVTTAQMQAVARTMIEASSRLFGEPSKAPPAVLFTEKTAGTTSSTARHTLLNGNDLRVDLEFVGAPDHAHLRASVAPEGAEDGSHLAPNVQVDAVVQVICGHLEITYDADGLDLTGISQLSNELDAATDASVSSLPAGREASANDPSRINAAQYRAAALSDLGFQDINELPPTEREQITSALSSTRMIPPEQVRFTQRSVSRETSEGMPLPQLSGAMAEHGWRGGPIHAVMWENGNISSLDNRRLIAARMAQLEHVPTALHAPNDRLADWPNEWDTARRERNPLGVDIRRLEDGTLRVGGDQGEIVYHRGHVADTWGEIALFRAAEQRSLLPGILEGSEHPPVFAAKPAKMLELEIPEDDHHEIAAAVRGARPEADAILADLRTIASLVTRNLGLARDSLELRGEDYRVKSTESLARKYLSERAPNQTVAEFLNHVNDLVRFSVRLPDGVNYLPALVSTFQGLRDNGYDVVEVKNFWRPGNRYFGTNTTIRAPNGREFEIQFPTEDAWRAGKITHELYEVFRRPEEPIERRIHAFLSILRVNSELNLSSKIPIGLDKQWRAIDTSFEKWILKNPAPWQQYARWLDENGRDLDWVAAQFGLHPTSLVSARSTD